jgi:hypothetical protein
MSTPAVHLPAEDAVELHELLEMMADWIDHDFTHLAGSIKQFTGSGYSLEQLRADIARFIFLLGGPGDRLIHGDNRMNTPKGGGDRTP